MQPSYHLIRGGVQSCGCLRIQRRHENAIHGACKTPEFLAWSRAKGRCFNPRNPKYRIYGGRGITMCKEWRNDFVAFLSHIGPRPSRQHSLDRIDVNGHYVPGNVRWATRTQQAGNQRKTVWTRFGAERVCLAELARRHGIPYKHLHKAFRTNGLSIDAAVKHVARMAGTRAR